MKNYDKRVKQTRILLGDYLLLKRISFKAGISMSEALHKVIVGFKPEPKPKPITEPVTKPAFTVKVPVALRVRSQPVFAVNGHKAGVFVIKPKGGIIQ
ncbi:hypothetical protein ES705_46857 [subsurface metagenome]